jgi:hypothetical protein
MRRIRTRRSVLAVIALGAIATTAVSASAAGAAPPPRESTHGRETVQVQCEGFGTLTVQVPSNEHSNGAGQIVGEKGHGIPVAFTATIEDVSKGVVLFGESTKVGHGHAHPNQPTTTCRQVLEASAHEFFGEELPAGVAPTDLIRATFEVQVIVKKK